VVANYLKAVDLDLAPGRISRVSLQGYEGEVTVRYRAVVNGTGPCLDLMKEDGGFRLRASHPPEQRNTRRPSTG
jgi:glycerol-3-phosphate dehydrogenase